MQATNAAVAECFRSPNKVWLWIRTRPASGQLIAMSFIDKAWSRLRLKMEGITFKGPRVDMAAHQYAFRVWELD